MDENEKTVQRAIDLSPAPLSVNEEQRTVEMLIATEKPVGNLVLRCTADAIISSPVVSILLDHRNETSAMAGRLISYRTENGKLIGVAQFTDAPAADTGWQLARAGCGVSVRALYKLDDVQFGTGTTPDVATRWRMGEVSLTPVQADYETTTRSVSKESPKMQHEGREDPMADSNPQAPPADAPGADAGTNTTTTVSNTTPITTTVTETRSVAASTVDAGQIRTATQNESKAILEVCRTAGLDLEFATGLLSKGVDLNEARGLVIDAMAARQRQQPQTLHGRVEVGQEHSQKRCEAMQHALEARSQLRSWDEGGAREYVGSTLLDMGRECLELSGVTTRGLTKDEIAIRALHSTTDFPLLLGSVQRVKLKAAYGQAKQTWRVLARQENLPDFRPQRLIEVGVAAGESSQGGMLPEELKEGGEYKTATLKETDGQWELSEYGKKLNIGRRLIINDNLGYITRAIDMLGRGIAVFEANMMWEMITTGTLGFVCMMDKKTLFHADHNNTVTGAIGEQSISDARQKMRNQKGFDGTPLYVEPEYILLPTTLETAFDKFNATVLSAKTSDVNPFSGKLQAIVEPRLDVKSTAQFYLTGSYPGVDQMVFGYLEGEAGPTIDSVPERDPDGLVVYLRHTFGRALPQHQWIIRSSGS